MSQRVFYLSEFKAYDITDLVHDITALFHDHNYITHVNDDVALVLAEDPEQALDFDSQFKIGKPNNTPPAILPLDDEAARSASIDIQLVAQLSRIWRYYKFQPA